MMRNRIVGFSGLATTIGVGYPTLNKWIKLYGFPKPEIVGNGQLKTWPERTVHEWLSKNKELVDNGVRKSRIYGGLRWAAKLSLDQ